MSARRLAFLAYDNRSGSTLLAALLNQYSGVCVSQETGMVARIIEYNQPLKTDSDIDRLLVWLEKEIQYRELNSPRHESREVLQRLARPIDKAALILALLELYFARRQPDATVWVVKGPRLLIHRRTIEKLFPDHKLIHIIRDGRAVLCSKRRARSLNGRTMEPNLLKAALDWRRAIRGSVPDGTRMAEVKFEELVSAPEQTLSRLLDFLGVAHHARRKTKSQASYAQLIGQHQRSLHDNVPCPPKKERRASWREELDDVDITAYEIIAGKELESRAYPVLHHGRRCAPLLEARALSRILWYALAMVGMTGKKAWSYAVHEGELAWRIRRKVADLGRHRTKIQRGRIDGEV